MIIRFTNLKEEDRTFEQKVLLRIISIEPVKNVQYKYKQSTTSSVNLDKSELAVPPDKHLRIIKKIDRSRRILFVLYVRRLYAATLTGWKRLRRNND